MIREIPTLFGDAVTTHDYSQIVRMNGQEGDADFTLRFVYNSRARRWSLTISNALGEPSVVGAVLVHGVNLLSYARPGNQIRGFLVLLWQSEDASVSDPEERDLGSNSKLYYFEHVQDLRQGSAPIAGLA